MHLLALDIGSSSVKAMLLRDRRGAGKVVRCEFATDYHDDQAEVKADVILAALGKAIRQLGSGVKKVDCIAAAGMSPSWVAMDRAGQAITPIVTHQDRRSVEIAGEIERRVGAARHLKLAGNRPFPGGISSTTAAWFARHAPGVMKRADLVGHLNTFLIRQWTGGRIADPSNASFMGVYRTLTLGGWCEELCDAVGVRRSQLPEVRDANVVAGKITPEAAARWGLRQGTPMLAGCIDTSAAALAVGGKPHQVINLCGSTDVLAVCTNKPIAHPRVLTRGIGVGRMWMQVASIAAAGSSITWMHQTFFSELSERKFFAMLDRLGPSETDVRFEPYLAGERMSIEQRKAAFAGLSLSTTRDDLAVAVIDALAVASAARLPLLKQVARMGRSVIVSGGSDGLSRIFHRDWGKGWRFHRREQLTAHGLAALAWGEAKHDSRLKVFMQHGLPALVVTHQHGLIACATRKIHACSWQDVTR